MQNGALSIGLKNKFWHSLEWPLKTGLMYFFSITLSNLYFCYNVNAVDGFILCVKSSFPTNILVLSNEDINVSIAKDFVKFKYS